jgi:hypothetical protein
MDGFSGFPAPLYMLYHLPVSSPTKSSAQPWQPSSTHNLEVTLSLSTTSQSTSLHPSQSLVRQPDTSRRVRLGVEAGSLILATGVGMQGLGDRFGINARLTMSMSGRYQHRIAQGGNSQLGGPDYDAGWALREPSKSDIKWVCSSRTNARCIVLATGLCWAQRGYFTVTSPWRYREFGACSGGRDTWEHPELGGMVV